MATTGGRKPTFDEKKYQTMLNNLVNTTKKIQGKCIYININILCIYQIYLYFI